MCAQKWVEINFIKVSSLCLDRHKRVFLNEGKDRAVPLITFFSAVSPFLR